MRRACTHPYLFFRNSTVILLHTFDTLVAVVLSVDTASFPNLFLLRYLFLFSHINCSHAETCISISRVPFRSKLSACNRLIAQLVSLSMSLSYGFDMTSNQSETRIFAFFYGCNYLRYIALATHYSLCTSGLLHSLRHFQQTPVYFSDCLKRRKCTHVFS